MAFQRINNSGGGIVRSNNAVAPDELGSGKGTPAGNKFLTDNQTYAKVKASNVDSGAATSGQVIKANGSGGAAWGDL